MDVPKIALPLLLLLASVSCSAGQEDPEAVEADVNHLVDDILHGLGEYIPHAGLSPQKLPDVHQKFAYTVLYILTINGELNLSNGSISNFESLERYDWAKMIHTGNRTVIIHAGATAKDVQLEYKMAASAGVLGTSGMLKVHITGLKTKAAICLDMVTLQVFLLNFEIVELGSIQVTVQNGVVGWLSTVVARIVTSLLKKDFKRKIEAAVKKELPKVLDSLDIPSVIRPPPSLTH